MREELYQEMFEMEQRHWWFAAKHAIIKSLLRRYLNPTDGRTAQLADLGCGCGMFLYKVQSEYDGVGMDDSPAAVEFCARRNVKVQIGTLPDRVPFAEGQFDAVLLLDVLEHLDDDAASLLAAWRLLRPGGILVCTVPAYPWLWSPRDEHHHHKRRYTSDAFAKLFQQPGLKMELFSHYNTWLFPPAAVARVARRWFPPKDGMDLHVPPAPINRMLQWAFASERHLLGRVRLPFGLSLIAIARKTT